MACAQQEHGHRPPCQKLQLRDLRSFLTSQPPCICRCTTTTVSMLNGLQLWELDCLLTDCTPRNLLDLHNRGIEHLINELQLENHYGFLNSPDHEDRLRVTTGMSTTLTSEDCAPGVAQQRACQTRSNNGTWRVSAVSCTICTVNTRCWSITGKSTTLSMNWNWGTPSKKNCWSLSLHGHRDVQTEELHKERRPRQM